MYKKAWLIIFRYLSGGNLIAAGDCEQLAPPPKKGGQKSNFFGDPNLNLNCVLQNNAGQTKDCSLFFCKYG